MSEVHRRNLKRRQRCHQGWGGRGVRVRDQGSGGKSCQGQLLWLRRTRGQLFDDLSRLVAKEQPGLEPEARERKGRETSYLWTPVGPPLAWGGELHDLDRAGLDLGSENLSNSQP